ncbi:MAG: lysophospholipid acyltransferase family protein [Pseudomonadota bacterium]
MNQTWQPNSAPQSAEAKADASDPAKQAMRADRFTLADWLRIARRGTLVALAMAVGVALLLPAGLLERALYGQARPWSPRIVQGFCRVTLRILGVSRRQIGRPMAQQGAAVANHASWFDIIVLNAAARVTFFSKADVADWPLIGFVAKAAGTRFISRDARDASTQRALLVRTLQAGHLPLFFPEGTSTDGARVLAFKSSLFAALFQPELAPPPYVQAISVIYHAPDGAEPCFYGWYGDMDFGAHCLKLLAAPRHGAVTLVFHPPRLAALFADRKALAHQMEETVRRGFTEHWRSVDL